MFQKFMFIRNFAQSNMLNEVKDINCEHSHFHQA